jgi:uncharacterized repeat protein (TIGR01451 family)
VSVTDGQAWLPVPGSEIIPRAEEFFFDQDTGDVYAATRGRGVWRITLPSADIGISKAADPDPGEKGELLTYTLEVANDGPDLAEDITLTDALPDGIEFVSASPTCAESGGTVTCDLGDLASSSVTNTVEITGRVSCALPDGTTVSNTASILSALTPDENLSNNESTAEVQVFDTTPPVIESLSVSPDSLWPPNHMLQTVTATVVATDTCDPSPVCQIVSVTSDEAVNGLGDGNTMPDWVLSGGLEADLRAERSGLGDGRIYTLAVECTDMSGNVSLPAEHEVIAPHDQRGN